MIGVKVATVWFVMGLVLPWMIWVATFDLYDQIRAYRNRPRKWP